ncbi:MAG TPA: cytochrome c biogenesis protein CcdA [Chloroflexota bacterium]|nr:cytochrome c biogenesis protein CcdA [Chloroflexota bacterium]
MNGPGAILVAFGGGIVSFLSPCTLPLLPGYLSFISGLGLEEVRAGDKTGTVLSAAALFVLGFSLVFVALGASASYIGSHLLPYKQELTRIAGIFVILMALSLLGAFRLPVLSMEKRFHLDRRFGVWSAFPVGMAFAFGWSPCIGPVYSSILAYAVVDSTVQRGALLLFVYSLGLGVPFLIVALFAGRVFESLGWFKRHYRAISRAGGGLLLIMGAFLVMGRWTEVVAPVMNWYAQFNLPS